MTQENKAAAAKDESTLAEAVAQGTERKSMESSSTEVNLRSVPAQPEHRRQDGWTSTPCGSDGIRKDDEYDMTAGERLQEQLPHPIEKSKTKKEHKKSKDGSTTSSSTNTRRRGFSALIEHRCVKTIGRSHPSLVVEVAAAAATTCWKGSDCRNNAHKVMFILNTIQKNILVHKFRIRTSEAGSIVFHSSSNVSEFVSDNKEARVTASAAAKVSEDFPNKDAEILRLIKERRSTPKEKKQRIKDLRNRIKNASEKEQE